MKRYALFALCLNIAACGGGSGTDSGVVLQGTLTEAGGADHRSMTFRHTDGEALSEVEVCALGECSMTDEFGEWGFLTSQSNVGGDTVFTVKGHGIDTSSVVTLPLSSLIVTVDLQHVEGGRIVASHVSAK